MKFPLYIIEEIIIRLQEFNPEIGRLKGSESLGSQMIIKTTKGLITVPSQLLSSQLHHPYLLEKEDIEALAKQFIRINKQKKYS